MTDSVPHHTKEALMYNTVKLYTNFIPYATSCFSSVCWKLKHGGEMFHAQVCTLKITYYNLHDKTTAEQKILKEFLAKQ
jgi:hypothetical protein